jgi:hypothetical protein
VSGYQSRRVWGRNLVTEELAIAIRPFLDGWMGPTMDQLEELFAMLGLDHHDPDLDAPRPLPKAKRVERVLVRASVDNPASAWALFGKTIDLIRAGDGFRPDGQNYPGSDAVSTLRSALHRNGYDLSNAGVVSATVFENFVAGETISGIRQLVDRARRGSDDPPLIVSTGKEVAEAAARCVIQDSGTTYSPSDNFPATMSKAFNVLGLSVPEFTKADKQFVLSGDDWERLAQSVYVLACELSRFRNEVGMGHGRPEAVTATAGQARVAAEAGGAIASMLLGLLEYKAQGRI